MKFRDMMLNETVDNGRKVKDNFKKLMESYELYMQQKGSSDENSKKIEKMYWELRNIYSTVILTF